MPTASKARVLRDRAKELKVAGWQAMERKELEEAIKAAEANGGSPKRSSRMAKAVDAMGHEPKARKSSARREAEQVRESLAARKRARATKKVGPRKKVARAETAKKASKRPAKAAQKATKTTPRPRAVAPSSDVNPFRSGSQLNAITEELIKGGKRQSMVNRLKRRFDIHPYATRKGDVDTDFEWDKRLLMCREKLVERGWRCTQDGRGREGTLQLFPPAKKRKAKK